MREEWLPGQLRILASKRAIFSFALHRSNAATERVGGDYFVGTAPAPEAVGAGADGATLAGTVGVAADDAAGAAAGTCAAPVSGPLAAGAVTLG